MAEELNDRGRRILEAIIEDYIASAEPVGSRAVTRRHQMALSPATVRNVMADLEEMGYLVSPHTSAGRVPTEKGYRFYVDSLLQVRQLSRKSSCASRALPVARPAGGGAAAGGRQGAFGDVRAIPASSWRRVSPAPSFATSNSSPFPGTDSGGFVTQSGLVQNKLVETSEDFSQSELEQIGNYLNRTLGGLTMQQVKARIVKEMAQEKALYDQLLQRALRLSEAACARNGRPGLYRRDDEYSRTAGIRRCREDAAAVPGL